MWWQVLNYYTYYLSSTFWVWIDTVCMCSEEYNLIQNMVNVFMFLWNPQYNNQKSISEEDELPLHEMASSVGLNRAESCSVYVVLLLSWLLILLDEVLWAVVVVTESVFETGRVELGMARETPNWNFASPPSICILLGV